MARSFLEVWSPVVSRGDVFLASLGAGVAALGCETVAVRSSLFVSVVGVVVAVCDGVGGVAVCSVGYGDVDPRLVLVKRLGCVFSVAAVAVAAVIAA